MTDDHEFKTWLASVPPDITTDTIWRMSAYRYSLFLLFCAQEDLRWILSTGRHALTLTNCCAR